MDKRRQVQNNSKRVELDMNLASFSMPREAENRRPVSTARQTSGMHRTKRQHQEKPYARRRKRRHTVRNMILAILLLLLLVVTGLLISTIFSRQKENYLAMIAELDENHPVWTESFLTPNDYSRPGDPIGKVKNIFVHYTANPGTNAVQNVSYFEQLKDTKERSASAHFVIGYQGDIIECIPLNEIAYAVKGRNEDSISIECCYQNEDGSFTQETYDSLLQLLVWLLKRYNLEPEDILRHYDCGGKKCPLYYVEHEEAWKQLKADVAAKMD